MKVKRKHFKGWLSAENMENPVWIAHWKNNAKNSDLNDKQLIVFEIPHDFNIEIIESFLQSKIEQNG